jgi:4-amino-4-deoxy-L-arabinose transferase-like glycosyltransferase
LPTRILTALGSATPLLLVLYAALLRFDALVTKYGLVAGSARVEAAQRYAQALADHLRPASLRWTFVGERHGDPVSYLKIARAKKSFYEANVREPLPLVTIQFFLWLTGDQDIAVSCASAFYSTLLVLAAYLVGSLAFSRAVGLGAGVLLASEARLINYGVDGWRDDGFAFFTLMTAYWLLRLRRSPSLANASFAGVFAAAACLTRLTSLSFVGPALAVLVIDGPREALRRRGACAALALAITAALVGPFLVNNWIAFGDPFYSFDFATELYRGRGSLSVDRPMAWLGPFADRVGTHPLATLDSLLHGFTSYPFGNKFVGLGYVSPLLPVVLRAATIMGLALLLVSADGRLLLVVLFTALIPFAVVWQAPSAQQWRLTVFTYSFYLIAAVQALRTASSLAYRDVRRGLIDSFRSQPRRWAVRGIVTTVGVAVAFVLMPLCWQYLLLREAALTDGAYSIVAGAADVLFFGEGWYPPVRTGNVTGRYSRGAKAVIRFPVFVPADSLLTLRMQPYSDEAEPARNIRVSINRAEVSAIRVEWNAQRAGSYDVAIPKELLHEGWNTIDLKADGSTVAPPDEQRFIALRAGQDTAFFLWYVRVTAAHAG